MGLSENEQRILDQLEDQLRAEDPGLARRAQRLAGRTARQGSVLQSALLFVGGLALLLLLTYSPLFAIAGAAVMLVALVRGGRALSTYVRVQADQARQKASRSDEV